MWADCVEYIIIAMVGGMNLIMVKFHLIIAMLRTQQSME